MLNLKRNIQHALMEWKNSSNRKPLVLRGARQVGKTTAVKEFGQSFDHYIYLNLEKEKDANFFLETDNVKQILDRIILEKAINVQSNESLLLFIDEVQELPEVIALLRYFYEDLSEIYVIAAGSLLEFALGDVSKIPVGRIQYLYMYPLNFSEFLHAQNKPSWLKEFNQVPIKDIAHDLLMEEFHKYCVIGGMPEVVSEYLTEGNATKLSAVYCSIWDTYKNDVEKYASNETERRIIRHILNTAPFYLDERIKFQNFGNSNYRSREVSESFKSIEAAGLIRLLYPTTSLECPVTIDYKKSPRMQFLDIGIINNTRKTQSELLGLKNFSEAYRGALIPQVIYQELISLNELTIQKPTFWVRDKPQSSAEVDLIYEYKDLVIPIEIKSGSTGSLKSLHEFIDRSPHHFAIRIYGGKFSVQQQQTPNGKPYQLMNLPYYLGTKINKYVAYLVDN